MAWLRPLSEDDADSVAAVYRAAWGDSRRIDAGEILEWLRAAPDRGRLQVLEEAGSVVGYGDVELFPDAVALEVAAPGHWDVFLEWAETTAREAGVPKVRVLLYAQNELTERVTQRGYHRWRSVFTMEMDLRGPLTPPVVPGIEIRDFRSSDTETLRGALNEAFGNDPFHHEIGPEEFGATYVGRRSFDSALWRVAWDNDELAAFALSYPERHGDTTLGYVYALGVRPAWRRRGIGRTLLLDVLERLRQHGLARATLGVDAENETGAVRLYESVGMRVTQRSENWVLDLPP